MERELVYFPSWVAGRKGYADRIRQVFQDYLKTHGLRLTEQRDAILDHLLAAERHLNLEEIQKAVHGAGVGRATVFRTLKMLEECRVVERVTTPNGRPRFEVKMERPHHDHFVCIDCGSIIEVRWPEVEKIQEKTCRQYGFMPLWHRHEIFGRCKECQKDGE